MRILFCCTYKILISCYIKICLTVLRAITTCIEIVSFCYKIVRYGRSGNRITTPGGMETDFFPGQAYCEKVKKILNKLYPSVPIAVINAGISGGSARTGLNRLERDVLSYAPDLVVVCFGLNDSGDGENGVSGYRSALDRIFSEINRFGAECIYMTPNTMNYNVSPKLKVEAFKGFAEDFASRMKNGLLDKYIEAGISAAKENKVTVCDCYSLWKKLSDCGVNVTELLANKLNHPDSDMHYLFAYELVKTMLTK